jgi:hypothetical protein
MRPALTLIALIHLAACTGLEPSAADTRARQEAACTAVIATQVGRPPAEVASRWISDDNGVARIEARDGDRLHICDVSSSGRVLDYSHPGA